MPWLLQHLIAFTASSVLFVIAISVVALVGSFRLHSSNQQAKAGAVAGAIITIAVTTILAVVVNQAWAMKREQDAREWAVRGQHLQRLKPILQADATKLQDLSAGVLKLGRFI